MAGANQHAPSALVQSFEVGEDLSAGRGLILKHSTTTGRVVSANSGDRALAGIAYENALTSDTSGVSIDVAGPGCTVPCKLDGSGTAIVNGDPVKPDNSGRGVKAATTDGDKIIGYYVGMATCSAANEFGLVRVAPQELAS